MLNDLIMCCKNIFCIWSEWEFWFQKKWKAVITETTTDMAYLWYKKYFHLFPIWLAFIHSIFPAVLFQISFPEREVVTQKNCWNYASFRIIPTTHHFSDSHKTLNSSQEDC